MVGSLGIEQTRITTNPYDFKSQIFKKKPRTKRFTETKQSLALAELARVWVSKSVWVKIEPRSEN